MNNTVEVTTFWKCRSSNVDVSIRLNRELDSNEIDEIDRQNEKHDDPRMSTLHGSSFD
jgi:hypothetical protein